MAIIKAGEPVKVGGKSISWDDLEVQGKQPDRDWKDVVWYDDERHVLGIRKRDADGKLIKDEETGEYAVEEHMAMLRQVPPEEGDKPKRARKEAEAQQQEGKE